MNRRQLAIDLGHFVDLRRVATFVAVAALGLASGCGDDPSAAAPDALDARTADTAAADTAPDTAAPDTAAPDTGAADTGAADTAVTDTAEPDPWMPAACWPPEDAACDARTAAGCDLGAGETCDVGFDASDRLVVACFPGPNDVAVGGACDPQSGPFCGPGLSCDPEGRCRAFCCDAATCATGELCVAFGPAGSLGMCATEAPSCGGPGAHCVRNRDCCSNDCHGDHCH